MEKTIKVLIIITLLSIIVANVLAILNKIKLYEQVKEMDRLIYRLEKKINVVMRENKQ